MSVSYREALEFFQANELYWEAFVDGIIAKKEDYFSDLKRNMETPNCNQRADDKVIGAITALDDLVYDFKLPAQVAQFEDVKEA